jgi:AcrR family transcriptional regulator
MAEDGWDRRRRQVEEHIEATALRLFAERGYDRVTVAEIADAAGISQRTFFRYFRAKQDVLWARAARAIDVLPGHLLDRPDDEPLLPALRAACEAMMSEVFTDQGSWVAWAAVVQETVAAGKVVRPYDLDAPSALATAIAKRDGEEPDDLRPGAIAVAVTCAMSYCFFRWVASGAHGDFAPLVGDAIDAVASLGR